jgi:hypothetical protein
VAEKFMFSTLKGIKIALQLVELFNVDIAAFSASNLNLLQCVSNVSRVVL